MAAVCPLATGAYSAGCHNSNSCNFASHASMTCHVDRQDFTPVSRRPKGACSPTSPGSSGTLCQHALVADRERGALIGPRGDVAFLCAPPQDVALFSSLVGSHGHYSVTSACARLVWGAHYEPRSLIWRSRWVTTEGVIECREALTFPGIWEQPPVDALEADVRGRAACLRARAAGYDTVEWVALADRTVAATKATARHRSGRWQRASTPPTWTPRCCSRLCAERRPARPRQRRPLWMQYVVSSAETATRLPLPTGSRTPQ